jgi:hypothetical protein
MPHERKQSMLKQLINRIKNWLYPQPTCCHCEATNPHEELHNPTGITADILSEGIVVGTAYNIEYEGDYNDGHHIYASSLVFDYDNLDRLFMNAVVDAGSSKLPFSLKSKDGNIVASEVYLVDGQKPIPAKFHGKESVWVNHATMDAGVYEEIT